MAGALVVALALSACGGPPTVQSTCQRQVAAGCSATTQTSCEQTGNALRTQCANVGMTAVFDNALTACANATYTCNASGQAEVMNPDPACASATTALLGCFVSGDSGSSGDASGD